jgi:SAM-dependent methyltransferase
MKNYERLTCRLCESKNLTAQLAFKPTPAADSYMADPAVCKALKRIPLTLMFCEACANTQLSHVIDGEEVYLNYIYESESTLGLGSHFKDAAQTVMTKFRPRIGGLVLDIGSNDGILLEHFKNQGMKVLGVDPMPGIAEKASKRGIPTVSKFFDEAFVSSFAKDYEPPAVICSNNLVADTDDLIGFIKNVKKLMNKDTLFFFETFYFYFQVKNNVWDFTYHEHYTYFTIKPLQSFLSKLGLELIDVEPNITKGGSIRCAVQLHEGNRQKLESVNTFIELERMEGFQSKSLFRGYSYKIDKAKKEFNKFISALIPTDKIVGYGASATTTTLVYNYELEGKIKYFVDDYKAKQGLYFPGTDVLVYNPEKLASDGCKYVVIFAWRYWQKIVQNNMDFLNKGGVFVVPLPEIRVITKDNLDGFSLDS